MSVKRLVILQQIKLWLAPYNRPVLSRIPHQSIILKLIPWNYLA